MKTLEEIKNEFEGKTLGGHEVSILTYHPEQEYPIIAELKYKDGWEVVIFEHDGTPKGGNNFRRLVKKKEPLPANILCETWDGPEDVSARYSDGLGNFYEGGVDSFIGGLVITTQHYKIVENKPQPWFGGECPIPDGVNFRIYLRNKCIGECGMNSSAVWTHNKDNPFEDIIAYQILGEDQ